MMATKSIQRILGIFLGICLIFFIYKSCRVIRSVSIVKVANYPNDFDISVKASGLSDLDFNTLLEFETGEKLIKLDSREAMLCVLKIPVPPPDTILVSRSHLARNWWDTKFDPFTFPDTKSNYRLQDDNIFKSDSTRALLIFDGGSYTKHPREGQDYYAFKSIQSLSFVLNGKDLFEIHADQSTSMDVFWRNSEDNLYIGLVYHK
jgi:hypothetical protein